MITVADWWNYALTFCGSVLLIRLLIMHLLFLLNVVVKMASFQLLLQLSKFYVVSFYSIRLNFEHINILVSTLVQQWVFIQSSILGKCTRKYLRETGRFIYHSCSDSVRGGLIFLFSIFSLYSAIATFSPLYLPSAFSLLAHFVEVHA